MARTTAAPTAAERLAALEVERERVLADLGTARERFKELRASRAEALGGSPDPRAARALDAEITSVRNDIETLEELLEDVQPRRLELQRQVSAEQNAISARAQAEREMAIASDELEIAQHMAAIRVIAERHGVYSTPFSTAPAAVCKLARGSRWTTWIPEQATAKVARAQQTIAELDTRP